MKVITGEPMLWLRDLAVTVERAGDGRTARVVVADNDADASGEQPPVAGAEVLVHAHVGEGDRSALATVATNEAGVAGFATPADVGSDRIVVSIRHAEFNPRHVRLDGVNLCVDLRRELYGR